MTPSTHQMREAIARQLSTEHGCPPDQLEPGDAYGIDGYLPNGDPAHFNWRRFVTRADRILAALTALPAPSVPPAETGTPETDGELIESIVCGEGDEDCTVYPSYEIVPADFARRLERERDEARDESKYRGEMSDSWRKSYELRLDEVFGLRAELSTLRTQLKTQWADCEHLLDCALSGREFKAYSKSLDAKLRKFMRLTPSPDWAREAAEEIMRFDNWDKDCTKRGERKDIDTMTAIISRHAGGRAGT